jgi:uncharacterized RDD family membrane protein YckC
MPRSNEYHFVRDGRRWGPVTLDELRDMVAARELPPTALVWREGMGQWEPFESLPELVPVAAQDESVPPGATLSYYRPTDGVDYAEFLERAGALLIDLAIFLIPIVVAVNLLEPYLGRHALVRELELLLRLSSVVLLWLYYALQECSAAQATIGKRIMGLKVTDEFGRRISFARATGRFFAKYLSAALLWVGFIIVAFTRRRQGLHDLLSGCLVVRSRDRK